MGQVKLLLLIAAVLVKVMRSTLVQFYSFLNTAYKNTDNIYTLGNKDVMTGLNLGALPMVEMHCIVPVKHKNY